MIVAPVTSSADVQMALARAESRTQLLERLTGQLTIGESFFFRNEHHFEALREHVIPEILRTNVEQQQIRMWTAGCAGGEEPYSLAILLDMILGQQAAWNVSILGTDLNPGFLARAREATYRAWSFRQTDVHKNGRYFQKEGETFRLISRVRDWVRFAYLNLVKDVYPSPLTGTVGLDLILFRNVAIYLKPDVTRLIIQRFHEALRPGGWLLLGETEVSGLPTDGFIPRRFDHATLHQKSYSQSQPVVRDVTFKRPVLVDAGMRDQLRMPDVPTIPDWVPLPVRTSHEKELSRPQSPALPDLSMQKSLPFAAWDTVEKLLAHQEFDRAESVIDGLTNKLDRSQVRLRYVRALMSSAEVNRARNSLEICLKEQPLSIESQLLKAGMSEEAGELKLAEQACRRALYIDRNCPMAHFHLALIQQQTGDYAGAKRSLHITLKLVEGKEPHKLVEYGEGVCYGRLQEMISLLISDT